MPAAAPSLDVADALALVGRSGSPLVRPLRGPADPIAPADPAAAPLPLPGPLTGLLPEGALRRGSTLRISRSTSLLLTLLGEASRAGAWCAAVRMPALGVLAAAESGIDLDRFALVPAPGESWSTVVAALLDALDVVVVAPPARTAPALARRLSARARERRAVLLVVGPSGSSWEGADAELTVTGDRWEGMGAGHGRLRTRSLEVRSSGRRVGGRPRTATLHLGHPDGRAALVENTRVENTWVEPERARRAR